MRFTLPTLASAPPAGPSHHRAIPTTPVNPPRRRVAPKPLPPTPPSQPSSQPPNPRSKSLLGSFRALPANTRIVIGLSLAVVGWLGLVVDRRVLPNPGGEENKPLISVRTVDRVDAPPSPSPAPTSSPS